MRKTAASPATFLLALCALGLPTPPSLRAAVIAPVKDYAKPDEPVLVKFENETGEEAKQALDKIGLTATKIEQWFTPADNADVFDSHNMPRFTLYTFAGEKIDPTPAKPEADGSVNIAAYFPQIKIGGTFILAWKDAEPLVIENLNNPGRKKQDLAKMQEQINALSDADRKRLIAEFAPTVMHIVPLQYAAIETEKGVIKAKFAYDVAPYSVDNFLSLARQGFYDGTVFHRIISGFMIQGGDSTGNIADRAGSGGPGYQIMEEFSDKKHERGTLSMARAQDPNSAGSQFFIMHAANPGLDGQYTAFGDVVDGMPVVDEIAKTPVSDNNGTVTGPKPKIDAVKILPATLAQYGIK